MLRYLPVVLSLALTIYCVVDAIQTPDPAVRNLPKIGWLLLILLFPLVGPAAWLIAGRPRRSAGDGRSQQQRWDDHRYYHQSRINQTLHLISAISFVVAYVWLFQDPATAALIAWGISMVTRQSGHFFFEPKGYDPINQVTHEYKEAVKVGYNLRRKVVLMTVWAASPLLLVWANHNAPRPPGRFCSLRIAQTSGPSFSTITTPAEDGSARYNGQDEHIVELACHGAGGFDLARRIPRLLKREGTIQRAALLGLAVSTVRPAQSVPELLDRHRYEERGLLELGLYQLGEATDQVGVIERAPIPCWPT